MMERYLFTVESLPKGFQFPLLFLEYVKREPIPDLDPWWFLCTSKLDADGWFQAIKRLYPTRKLVPFALWLGSDDVACFDASELSGNPKVYFVHTYASPGWEDRGQVADFTAWLKIAEEESARYKAECVEDVNK